MTRKDRSEFVYSACTKCGAPKKASLASWCYRCVYARRKEMEERAKDVLGRCCVRCGIRDPLVWDHVNDDGNEERRRDRSARGHVWRECTKIVETGRSHVLQLLCPNCNTIKAIDRAEYDRPPTYGPLSGLGEVIADDYSNNIPQRAADDAALCV